LRRAVKACQKQTHYFFGPIHALQKLSTVNMTLTAVFTTLHLLRDLRIGQIAQSVTLHPAGKACQGQKL
jgi:hypothetical protein